MQKWWDETYSFRIPIKVSAGEFTRIDRVVDVEIDLTSALIHLDQKIAASLYACFVVEVDSTGSILSDAIPFQFDLQDNRNLTAQTSHTLTLYLPGITPAGASRHFHAYFCKQEEACAETQPSSYVKLTDAVMHECQESYKIETPGATYMYHKSGGGFASLFDPENSDWISFHPWGGSDGIYRGVPNLVHPEGYFHPGNDGCHSYIVYEGPVKATILSSSKDGLWTCMWDITPKYATLTVLEAAQPYWFLYEGTPGGKLDEEGDYIVRSSGERTPASVRWDGVLPEPEWLYFGTHHVDRVLYLVHHEHDDAIDSYWPMEHNMTVFGFGRLNLNKYMQSTPAHFTIGFAESSDFSSISTVIDSAFRPIRVEVEQCQSLEL